MKKIVLLCFVCQFILVSGCASTGRMEKVESASELTQKNLRETDQRLKALESNVSTLNGQVAQINNRTYEVHTRNGRKTGMTVVAISPPLENIKPVSPVENNNQAQGVNPQQANTHQPPQANNQIIPNEPNVPSARKIDPNSPTTPLTGAVNTQSTNNAPAINPSTPQSPQTSNVSGPKGQVGGTSLPQGGPSGQLSSVPEKTGENVSPMLPPVSAPTNTVAPTPVQVPSSSQVNPSLPPADLSLPPVGMPQPNVNQEPPMPVKDNTTVLQEPKKNTPLPRASQGEEGAYKTALNTTRSGRYNEGIAQFQTFLQQYPQGRYAANAEYWIGESLYAQGKYKEALNQFQKVNTSYSTHHKNADALLKAGMCLTKLGDKEGASQKYKTLINDFPRSEAANIARRSVSN